MDHGTVAPLAHHRHRHRRRARRRLGGGVLGVEPGLDRHRPGIRRLPARAGAAVRRLAGARRARDAGGAPAGCGAGHRLPRGGGVLAAGGVVGVVGALVRGAPGPGPGAGVRRRSRYRSFGRPTSIVAGAAAGAVPGVLDPVFWYPQWTAGWKLAYLLACVASSALIAGLGSWALPAGWRAPASSTPSPRAGSAWASSGVPWARQRARGSSRTGGDSGTRDGPLPSLATVSFTIEPGELVVLMGASGSGKSTLLAALAGTLPDGGDSGSLLVEGPAHAPAPDRAGPAGA